MTLASNTRFDALLQNRRSHHFAIDTAHTHTPSVDLVWQLSTLRARNGGYAAERRDLGNVKWCAVVPEPAQARTRLRSPLIVVRKALSHQEHDMCTFDFCEYSSRDFTAVEQRHEFESCQDGYTCFRHQTLFRESALVEALKSNQRLTAWTLNGQSVIKPCQSFLAISHVWSDGTGVGVWPRGEVNACLFSFFRRLAEQFQCEGIWWDMVCIPKDKVTHAKALNNMQANYENARVTLVHDLFLRKLECKDTRTGLFDPKMACFAIVMSPGSTTRKYFGESE